MDINERRHELLLKAPMELLAIWQRVTGASDDDTTKKSYLMIQEILDFEFSSHPAPVE